MSEEQTEQEQTEEQGTQEAEQTQQPSALEERLAKLEGSVTEQKGYITKLEQENSTYRQIITDRGQAGNGQPQNQQATVSEIDREIEALERQVEAGEITPEELSVKSLRLIRKAKDAGRSEAVREVTNMYTQEQEITRRFNSIFEDPDLKGMESDMSDIAYGYMQAGIAQGMQMSQAAEYAKTQTKNKLNTFKSRFGGAAPTSKKEIPAGNATGLKGEGEAVKKVQTKEAPVTAEQSQKSFIEMRRSKFSG